MKSQLEAVVALMTILLGGIASADADRVAVPTNRVVVGIEFGSIVSNVCWRPIRYKDAFADIFREYIVDVTPVSRRVCGVRFFGFERIGANAKDALERDLARAVSVLTDRYGLKLESLDGHRFRGRAVFDGHIGNDYAKIELDIVRSAAIRLSVSDCELTRQCRVEQEVHHGTGESNPENVRLLSLMGHSFPATNDAAKISFTNCHPFCRVDLVYLHRRLSQVSFVQGFTQEVSLEDVRATAEACKSRIEADLGVRFVESNLRGGPYSYKECECSYRSLTAAGRFVLSMAIRRPTAAGKIPREMTIQVSDNAIGIDYRGKHVSNSDLKRMRLGSFRIGERYAGSEGGLLCYGMDNAFSVTNGTPLFGLSNCVAHVDRSTMNVIEAEFWESRFEYADDVKLRHAFEDLCERMEKEYGILLPVPEENRGERKLCLHGLEYGEFNVWIEGGERYLPLENRAFPALSLKVRHCAAYDKWYESRFMSRESEWEASYRRAKPRAGCETTGKDLKKRHED